MRWDDRIKARIKLRDLHVFETVATFGSMTRAAGQLAITVPVVSKAVADLEHQIGARLLDRSARGAKPTVAGRMLLERSRIVFDELRSGVQEIEALSNPDSGDVNIGTTRPLAASFLSVVVGRLSARYPRIRCRIMTTESETLFDELNKRNVDLLIIRKFAAAAGDETRFEKLYEDPYVIAAGATSGWARRRKVTLADLATAKWALPPEGSLVGAVVSQAFRKIGVEPPVPAVVSFQHDMRIGLATLDDFVTVLPRSLVRYSLRRAALKELPVDLDVPSGPIGILTLKKRKLHPVVQRFIDAARDVARASA